MLAQELVKTTIAVAASVVVASAGTLSGKVINADSSGKSGVTVTLSGTALTTTTDVKGAWSLEVGVGVRPRQRVSSSLSSNLVLADGQLRFRFQERDLRGRELATQTSGKGSPKPATAIGVAGRIASALPDTLVYSFAGKVFLRDTITNLSTHGIVRTYDTSWNPAVTYGYLTDSRDGLTYRYVTIGQQVWMAQNLNFKVDSSWWYKNNADNGAKYGRLYKWAAVMSLNDSCGRVLCAAQVTNRIRGICPSGWHVPEDAEWTKLTDTILSASTAGKVLRSTTVWYSPGNGTDEFGFRVIPTGGRNDSSFYDLGTHVHFWSATERSTDGAWTRFFSSSLDKVNRYNIDKLNGLALRCIQDSE